VRRDRGRGRERREWDLEVVGGVELVGGEEGVQVDVGLAHVLAIGVDDLQESVHSEADIHTAVHLGRDEEETEEEGGGED
jgi:hypothetical protein